MSAIIFILSHFSLKEKGFQTNFYLVLGDTHVTEELLGLKFRISQDAFFQGKKHFEL